MNSTTGEFSEIKRSSLTDQLYNRGTQSCVKQQSYLPRKLINLKPLNFSVIKKEIEHFEEQEIKENQKLKTNFNEADEQNELFKASDQNEYSVVDKSNHGQSDKFEGEDKNKQCSIKSSTKNDLGNNSAITVGKENKLVHCGQKNNSFDLNFSALTLVTPVKQNVKTCITNSTHSASNDIKSEHIRKEHFDGFLTPEVNTLKTRNSLLNKPCLKTPVNSYNHSVVSSISTKPIFSQKISPNLMCESELTNKAEEKQEAVVSPGLYNVFKKIKVKNVNYVVLNLLGKGGSSEVFHCYNPDNKLHAAIKCVSLENAVSVNSYVNEVKLLQKLQNCDKIIKMYDYEVLDSDKKLLVVLEKGGEDLSAILKQLACQQSHIPVYKLLFYWMEMLYAVSQIHSHGIIHSDLKPANFLKCDGGLKLIDFGIASSVQADMTSIIKSVPEGSLNYVSPEALNNDSPTNSEDQNLNNLKSYPKYKVHYKSDVWSLGCILYQLVYRRTPFQHITQMWPKLAAIMNPDSKIDYPAIGWVPPRIINTIKKCLQYNVKSRPSVADLIAEYEEIFHNM